LQDAHPDPVGLRDGIQCLPFAYVVVHSPRRGMTERIHQPATGKKHHDGDQGRYFKKTVSVNHARRLYK